MKHFLLILLLIMAVSTGATNLNVVQDTLTSQVDSAMAFYDLSRMPDTQWSYITDSWHTSRHPAAATVVFFWLVCCQLLVFWVLDTV